MSGSNDDLDGPCSFEDLRAIIADTGALPDAGLVGATPAEQGKNTIYYLTVETGSTGDSDLESAVDSNTESGPHELVCKVGDYHAAEGCRAEPYLLERVAERTTVPVPDVLAAGELDAEPDARESNPYFFAERVPGENYECAPERLSADSFERVCLEAGCNLGELHAAFAPEGFGLLGVDAGAEELRFTREFPDWPSYFEAWLVHNAGRLGGTRFADLAPEIEERAPSFAADLRELGPFDPVVTHGDYRLGNLLLNVDNERSDRITNAVVDWATPVAATAEYELAVTEALLVDWPAFDAERQRYLRERLYEGYRETNGDAPARDADFEARRRLYELGARLRLLVNLDEEMAGRSESAVDARADEHRRVLAERYDIA